MPKSEDEYQRGARHWWRNATYVSRSQYSCTEVHTTHVSVWTTTCMGNAGVGAARDRIREELLIVAYDLLNLAYADIYTSSCDCVP